MAQALRSILTGTLIAGCLAATACSAAPRRQPVIEPVYNHADEGQPLVIVEPDVDAQNRAMSLAMTQAALRDTP